MTRELTPDEQALVNELHGRYVGHQLEALRLEEKISKLRKRHTIEVGNADDVLTQIRKIEDGELDGLEGAASYSDCDTDCGSDADSDGDNDDSAASGGGAVTRTSSPLASTPPDAHAAAWRVAPITLLKLAEIDGLGKAKRQRLIDEVPTFGVFDDLRGKARREYKHLSTFLPKGIGESCADELESQFLLWLTENQGKFGVDASTGIKDVAPPSLDSIPDRKLSVESKRHTHKLGRDYMHPVPTVGEVLDHATNFVTTGPNLLQEGVDISLEPADDEPSLSEATPATLPESDREPDDSPEYTEYRFEQLKSQFGVSLAIGGLQTLPPDVRNEKATFDDGVEACRRGWPVTDCSWAPGPRQDAWLLGYASSAPIEVQEPM